MDHHTRHQHTSRIAWLGAILNIFLGLVKVVFGFLGHSQALIADGIHSFSDLMADALVLFASYYGSQEADIEHPYGHARIETAATVGLSVFLAAVGVGIGVNAVEHLVNPDVITTPSRYVVLVLILSLVVKEYLYHATVRVASRVNSELLRTNAWHHRSDAASSLVALLGVVGALLGFGYLDVVAALIVGLMIVHMGVKLGWSSIRELIDTGVDEATLATIESTIFKVPGVRSIHQLRTRSMGNNILIDVHVLVASEVSVSEGHYISDLVHHALLEDVSGVSDVTVHIDTSHDTDGIDTLLPSREALMPIIMAYCRNLHGINEVKRIVLHYLVEQIDIEFYMPMVVIADRNAAQNLEERYRQALATVSHIGRVKLVFVLDI